MWWPFAGVTGMGIPPLILAIPPASLTAMLAIIDSPFCKDEIGSEERSDEPGYDVAAGVGEDTVRWSTEMGPHTQLIP